jgi:ATP-binding cassette subfamily F protein uup
MTLVDGDRIGLIGPNGSGKSTLLKILMAMEGADEGSVSRRQGLRLGYACQEPDFPAISVEQVLLQQEGLHGDPISLETRASILLSKAQFDNPQQEASKLSGGWKKRLDIVRALMLEPDFLLLDEPTNHLDLEGIAWLEKLLSREKISYIAVSHDRYFLENVCNKVIELNRCYPQGLFCCDGPMSSFMEQRVQFLKAQEQQQRGLASVVRQEVAWLQKSPQARTTKSRSRVSKAYELIDNLSEIKERNVIPKVQLEFTASERATRKLLVAKNIAKSLGGRQLFKNIEITLSPGSRLGIVGGNGTGKTTLLKLLAGQIPQDMGTIKYAEDLKLVYFDQHREQLPYDLSLRRALSPHSDMVNYRGQEIHVNGWAKRFLFAADRLSMPIGSLSGGERARILIAKLMLQPADILFLDEPTNDLDIQTLEIIENSLQEFAGAVVLISHDRCLMDRVCTQFLGLGANSSAELFADYSQWEAAQASPPPPKERSPAAAPKSPPPAKSKKLSYKEQRELDTMEATILEAEASIATLHEQLESPTLATDSQRSLALYNELAAAQQHLEQLFARWEFLSQQAGS